MRLQGLIGLLGLVAGLLPAATAGAQEFASQTRGTSANTAYQVGDIDTVNLFNGNLSLAIPIGPRYPVGGGLSYGLTLTYNSNHWDYEDDSCLGTQGGPGVTLRYQVPTPDPENNAGLGWNLTLGHFRTEDASGPNPNPPRIATWEYV
ncbi:MAG: hypothetical protein KDD47_26910, partial [Acidobacteria bacterium]|nr:hypothetical protein [Acidobacteriota bacterium]